MNLIILIPPRISFINETLSSLAFMRLSCAFTTTFPAKWFKGRNRHVTSNPNRQETPSKSYRKAVPTTSSMGASVGNDELPVPLSRGKDSPMRVYKCQAKSLTRSMSVVMRVMICALEEKSSSCFLLAPPFLSSLSPVEASEPVEARSFRTNVLENKMELSCTRNLTWRVVVLMDQS